MVMANGISRNGHSNGTNHSNGVSGHLICESDYEERPLVDVTPSVPLPRWRDALAPFTHCLSWADADGCSHSLTLRHDTLEGLLGDLRLIKSGIKQAKE